MLFKKHKKDILNDDPLQNEILALTSLVPLCNTGRVHNDSFIIEDFDLCVYADVISIKDNVAQVAYQLHHSWLDEPIVESVAASGDTIESAIHAAAKSFMENILSLYIASLTSSKNVEKVRIEMNRPLVYNVYRGNINGVGAREGTLEGDFWDLLKDDILMHLSDRKAHWIRVFTSKNKNNVICELRIDGHEVSSLSEKLISYAEEWNSTSSYHSEKQGILLIQDTNSYEKRDVSADDIKKYTNKTMQMLEKCYTKEEYLNTRKQLYKLCGDESLTHEIFYLIPELYCVYAYPKVEFGDKLYLICKQFATREIQQSQLYSFAHVKRCVEQHLKNDNVNRTIVDNVLRYSANAKAIQRALDEGSQLEELLIPGIGILVPNDYVIK